MDRVLQVRLNDLLADFAGAGETGMVYFSTLNDNFIIVLFFMQGGSADPDPFAVVEVLSSHGSDVAVTKAAVRGAVEGLCVYVCIYYMYICIRI